MELLTILVTENIVKVELGIPPVAVLGAETSKEGGAVTDLDAGLLSRKMERHVDGVGLGVGNRYVVVV